MGRRRASTSQLEVKHGNFSAIKSPNRSRAASPAASPRASPSPTASPNRRLSEGSQVKDVGLMREAYSKARNMLLAKRASREEAEDEGHEGHEEHEDGGFKRVGKALVTGMSHALFNRGGSNKNQGLMKSLMAAISKEKILSRISELDLDEQVSDMLGEMYQGMIELLIDNYEPLEGALGELLDEAVTGSQDLEPFIDNLRDAVTGSLVAMLSKQEPLGVGITRPQEILLDRVVEAAQGMASEISYTIFFKSLLEKIPMKDVKKNAELLPGGDLRSTRNAWVRAAWEHSGLKMVPREKQIRLAIGKLEKKLKICASLSDDSIEEWIREQAWRCHDILLKHARGKRKGHVFKPPGQSSANSQTSMDNMETQPLDLSEIPALDEEDLILWS